MIFSIVAPAGAVAIRPATSPTAQKSTKIRRILSPPNMECRFCIAANHVIAVSYDAGKQAIRCR
jgi:hypothetical protein